jgi:FtsP/CotA-like multicopper oxidase with cupredoxin domain
MSKLTKTCRIVLLALAAAAVTATPASAHWLFARWGMTPEQAKAGNEAAEGFVPLTKFAFVTEDPASTPDSRILATDGGLLESPVEVTELLLPPADRVEIAVGPFAAGEVLAVEALEYLRMTMKKRRTERFATLRVGPAAPSRAAIPERLRTIAPLAAADAAPTRTVKLGFGLNLKQGLDFRVNGERHHHDAPVRVGELQVWDVVNATLMDHPFHLHGFFFQVLEVNGEPPPFRSWEDTVNVPPRGRVRIAWMPDDRPGEWMYHCHILEHHASGMMAHFEVVPRA